MDWKMKTFVATPQNFHAEARTRCSRRQRSKVSGACRAGLRLQEAAEAKGPPSPTAAANKVRQTKPLATPRPTAKGAVGKSVRQFLASRTLYSQRYLHLNARPVFAVATFRSTVGTFSFIGEPSDRGRSAPCKCLQRLSHNRYRGDQGAT